MWLRRRRVLEANSSDQCGFTATIQKGLALPRQAVVEVSESETYMRAWLAEGVHSWSEMWLDFFLSGYNGCSGHLVGHLTHNRWM